MGYLWFWCALLAVEAVPENRVSFRLELRALPAGLRLAREPQALVLQRDGVPVHRLPLPAIPKKAQRKDDHAVLALGAHGLWILRLSPEGRLVVVARHRFPKPVDGFFFEANRVVPTTGGKPFPLHPLPPKIRPPAQPTPSRETDIWPVEDRLRELTGQDFHRMLDWPERATLAPPVSTRPKVFLETNFLQTLGLPSTTVQHNPGHLIELFLRVGYHLTPRHVLGLSFAFGYGDYEYHDLGGGEHTYRMGEYANPLYFFYRYSMDTHPVEVQLEPVVAEVEDSRTDENNIILGIRVGAAWVRRNGPMRFGVEVRLDLFLKFVQPSVSLIYGINF